MTDYQFSAARLLDDISDLVQSVAPDGKFLYVNRAWREALGYHDDEISRMNVFDIVTADSLAHCSEIFRRVLAGESFRSVEVELATKSGSVLKVEGSIGGSADSAQQAATCAVFRIVSEQKKADQALIHSEDLFQAFMKNSPVVAFMKDEKGRYVYANETLESMFQIEIPTLLGKTDFEWLPEEIAEAISENDRKVLSSQQNTELLEIVPTPDGAATHWMVFKFPFTDAGGKKYIGGAAVNVSRQKEHEINLRQKQQEIETLLENSLDVIARFDENLCGIYVNAALETEIGIKHDDFIGKNVRQMGLPEEFCNSWEAFLRRVFANGEASYFESYLDTPNGLKYFQVRLMPEFTPENVVRSVLIVSRDITERKETEKKLLLSEEYYRHLVESSQGLICTHDLDGNLLSVNEAARDALGFDENEMVGRNLGEFIALEERKHLNSYLRRIAQNGVDENLTIVIARNGTERTWKYQNRMLTRPDRVPFVLGYAQDITEIKQFEKHLKNLSLTDDLTGLYNRRGFLALAERQLRNARAERKQKNIFIVFADMDGLKQINDRLGHEQGSLAIIKTSEILASNFRGSDVIARIGGDEFVVLVVDERDETQTLVVNRLQEKIARYNAQKNHEFDLSLSVGITPVNLNEPIEIESLLRRADEAMYEQKRKKKRFNLINL